MGNNGTLTRKVFSFFCFSSIFFRMCGRPELTPTTMAMPLHRLLHHRQFSPSFGRVFYYLVSAAINVNEWFDSENNCMLDDASASSASQKVLLNCGGGDGNDDDDDRCMGDSMFVFSTRKTGSEMRLKRTATLT